MVHPSTRECNDKRRMSHTATEANARPSYPCDEQCTMGAASIRKGFNTQLTCGKQPAAELRGAYPDSWQARNVGRDPSRAGVAVCTSVQLWVAWLVGPIW